MPNVMATSEYRWHPLLKMMRSKSSVIPFLVPCCKVWLMPIARVPCSNAANTGECNTWTQSEFAPGRIPLGENVQSAVLSVQQCISVIEQWIAASQLRLNMDKTDVDGH